MKKALAILLSLILLLTALPVIAAETTDYLLDGKTVLIYTANIRGDITVLPQVAELRNFYQAQGADVILADLGNFLQGTIYSVYDSGRTVIELMDAAGYDIVAIGSYEFAFGTGRVGVETHGIIYEDDSLGQLLEEASFYAVSANIFAEELHAFSPNAVVELPSGRSIGFFGLTDPNTSNNILEANIAGLYFADPGEIAAEQAEALAEADVVFALSNVGVPLLAKRTTVIDVSSEAGLTVGVLIIDNETGRLLTHSLVNLANFEPDEAMLEAVEAVQETVHEEFPVWAASEVTLEGSATASRLGETNLGNLWTDALLWFALEGGIANFYDPDDIDAGNTGIMVDDANVVAVWNGGNLRDFLNTGHVTMKDLQRVLPFPNRVAVLYLTGAQMLEMLEAATQGLYAGGNRFPALSAFPHVAGIEFTLDTSIPFDAGEAYGNNWYRANAIRRVTIDSINGNTFDPNALYAIVTSNAIFNGMDSNYISLERNEDYSTITSALVVDVVWMFIMQELGGVIGEDYLEPQGRITIQ